MLLNVKRKVVVWCNNVGLVSIHLGWGSCMLLYFVYKPPRSCLLPFCASPIFHFLEFLIYLSPLFLWSVMIVEWCTYTQKNPMTYCISLLWYAGDVVTLFSIYHCIKFSVSQCSMNMYLPIGLCYGAEVHYCGNLVVKKNSLVF